MNKYEALKEIFDIDEVYTRLKQYNSKAKKLVDPEQFLVILAKESYNLAKELELSAGTVSKLMSIIFPGREKTTGKVDAWLLGKYELKYCAKCEQVKPFEDFNKNKAQVKGINTYCKICHNNTNAETQAGRTSKYRASKLQRTVAWADEEKIKQIYNDCPIGHHVDHIIPLQGEFVSGLHVENNLQYLLASENCSKGNRAPLA